VHLLLNSGQLKHRLPVEQSQTPRRTDLKFVKLTQFASMMLLTASLSLPALAADNQLSSEEQAQGWQLLFNGKDMSQWRNFKKADLSDKWQIEDGAMKLTSGGGGDILTKQQYQNFELMLDWKIAEAGNSGIFVLANETGNMIYSNAPEIQILDNERHSDNQLASHRSGSLYDMIASPPSSHKKAGEWNTVKIHLQHSVLTIWQNGVQTAKVTIDSPEWQKLLAASKFATWQGFAKAKSGHIGLQDHGDQVWFKNIKIKELN
jgi:hypothetical protein